MSDRPSCKLCGGTAGSLNADNAHNLCAARVKLGLPTPSLGTFCEDCKGTGYKPHSAVGPMLDFNHGPATIKRALDAWAPKCTKCGGKGYTQP